MISMQGFIKNSGQRSLTYDASNISRVAGGDTVEELEVHPASQLLTECY